MADPTPTTATALAIALQLKPDSLLQAGLGLRLTSSGSATAVARSVVGTGNPLQPTAALARATGLGAGKIPNATILSGGGLIDGVISAKADSTGSGPTSAEALASNIGLAGLTYLSRSGQPLQIGTGLAPLAAQASARTDVLVPGPMAAPTSLKALATVRGLEGNAPADAAALPRFYGQPSAVVEAASTLQFDNPASPTTAAGRADAAGLVGYAVLAVPADPGSLGIPAQIGGDATAKLNLIGSPGPLSSHDLGARAIGVDGSVISATWGRDTLVNGAGMAELSGALPAGASAELLGLGIRNSAFFGADGNDTVIGRGGTKAPLGSGGLAVGLSADAAGIDRSTLLTGAGDDTVFGSLFGDQSAGFAGIRQSTVRTGAGSDLIAGSSSGSLLDGGDDDDVLVLDRSETSALQGGGGDDRLTILGTALSNGLAGGAGDDTIALLAASGSGGNVLDGGYGHDRLEAASGNDRYLQSQAGAALQAARPGFDSLLTDSGFWAALSDSERQELQQNGRLGGQTVVDTFAGFAAGPDGDQLELNSSLAGIRQDLWQSDGALYRVNNGGLEVIEGRGSQSIGVVLGTLAEIQSLGMGAPSIAYATDTRQLMFDADSDWRSGAISLGTLLIGNGAQLQLDNLVFGASHAV
jgi:hypothetical protein